MKIFVLLMLLIGTLMVAGCGEEGEIMDTVDSVMDYQTVEPTAEPQSPVTIRQDPVTTRQRPVGGTADMVLIPAGVFQMGSNDPEAFIDEQPVRTVNVSAFYIDRYEVTNAQYRAFVIANSQWQKGRIQANYHDGDYLEDWTGNNYPSGKANHPVVYVSWYAARAYATWVGKRLPTEAEWEKAARGKLSGRKYPGGNSIDAGSANYGNGVGDTTSVGRYPANGYGLSDMAGNVWEWCSDVYDNIENSRVLRGGSWSAHALDVRVSFRGADIPTFTNDDVGFRCVK